MEFKNDITTLDKPSNISIKLEDMVLPTNNDVYFLSKQQELVEQYKAARRFLVETETDDWNHWFDPVDNETANEALRLIYKSHFFETALFYYNAVVDISWVLCYVSIEFVCMKAGIPTEISKMKSIGDAYDALRNAENSTQSPTAKDNPIAYLKELSTGFIPEIELVVEFWKKFASSNIRLQYNFCKHKGQLAYTEIEKLREDRTSEIYVKDMPEEKIKRIVSNISDVRLKISLKSAISELLKFDNNELFPYIEKLIETIDENLKPSSLVL